MLGTAYDAALAPIEALGLRALRARVLSGARGRVLELGGGTGLNLPLYRDVDEVVVCEPDASMRGRLVDRSARAEVPVSVSPCGAPGLPFPAASFDTVVCFLVLCMVREPDAALADLHRVLKPDGQVLFIEHVRAPALIGTVQTLLTPAWSRVAGGCQLDRDTIGAMRAAGFVITDCERPAPLGRISAGTVVHGRAIPRRGT